MTTKARSACDMVCRVCEVQAVLTAIDARLNQHSTLDAEMRHHPAVVAEDEDMRRVGSHQH
jgi:hypothetical protein